MRDLSQDFLEAIKSDIYQLTDRVSYQPEIQLLCTDPNPAQIQAVINRESVVIICYYDPLSKSHDKIYWLGFSKKIDGKFCYCEEQLNLAEPTHHALIEKLDQIEKKEFGYGTPEGYFANGGAVDVNHAILMQKPLFQVLVHCQGESFVPIPDRHPALFKAAQDLSDLAILNAKDPLLKIKIIRFLEDIEKRYGLAEQLAPQTWNLFCQSMATKNPQVLPFNKAQVLDAVRVPYEKSGLPGAKIYHGTLEDQVQSVMAGPKNRGKGFGGQGLYLALDDKPLAVEYADHAFRSNGRISSPVVMEGHLDAHGKYRVARIQIAPRYSPPNFEKGIFPATWASDAMIQKFMLDHFDIIEVHGAANAGYAISSNRYVVIHESATAKSINWNKQILPEPIKSLRLQQPVEGPQKFTMKPATQIGEFNFPANIQGKFGRVIGTCYVAIDKNGMTYVTGIKEAKFIPVSPNRLAVGVMHGVNGLLMGANIYQYKQTSQIRHPDLPWWMHLNTAVGATAAQAGLWYAVGAVAGSSVLIPAALMSTLAALTPDPKAAYDHARDIANSLGANQQHELSKEEMIRNIQLYDDPYGRWDGVPQETIDKMELKDIIALDPARLENYSWWAVGNKINEVMGAIGEFYLSLPDREKTAPAPAQQEAAASSVPTMAQEEYEAIQKLDRPKSSKDEIQWKPVHFEQAQGAQAAQSAQSAIPAYSSHLNVTDEEEPFDPKESPLSGATFGADGLLRNRDGKLIDGSGNPLFEPSSHAPRESSKIPKYKFPPPPLAQPPSHFGYRNISDDLNRFFSALSIKGGTGEGFEARVDVNSKETLLLAALLFLVKPALKFFGIKTKAEKRKKLVKRQCEVVSEEDQKAVNLSNEAGKALKKYFEEEDPDRKKELYISVKNKNRQARDYIEFLEKKNGVRLNKRHYKMNDNHDHSHAPRQETKEHIRNVNEHLESLYENLLIQKMQLKITESDEFYNEITLAYFRGEIDYASYLKGIEKYTSQLEVLRKELTNLRSTDPDDRKWAKKLSELDNYCASQISDLPETLRHNQDIHAFLDKQTLLSQKLKGFEEVSKSFLEKRKDFRAGKISPEEFEKAYQEHQSEIRSMADLAKALKKDPIGKELDAQSEKPPESDEPKKDPEAKRKRKIIKAASRRKTPIVRKDKKTKKEKPVEPEKPVNPQSREENLTGIEDLTKDYLKELSDFVKEDTAWHNILEKLIYIESILNSKTIDMEALKASFAEVDVEWEKLSDKASAVTLMEAKAAFAFRVKNYEVAKSTALLILAIDPNNFSAVRTWLESSIYSGGSQAEALSFLQAHQHTFQTPKERSVLLFIEGKLKNDKGILLLAFSEMSQHLAGAERYRMQECLFLIEKFTDGRREVLINIADPSANAEYLFVEQWLLVTKLQVETIEQLKKDLEGEADLEKRAILEGQIQQAENTLEETIAETRRRLGYINSIPEKQRLIYFARTHFIFDVIFDLFGQRLISWVSSEPKEDAAAVKNVASAGFMFGTHLFTEKLQRATAEGLKKFDLGPLSANQEAVLSKALGALEQGKTNLLAQLYTKSEFYLLLIRLVVSVINLAIKKRYDYSEEKQKKLSFNEWMNQSWTRWITVGAAKVSAWMCDIAFFANSCNTLWFMSNAKKLELARFGHQVVNTILLIPGLAHFLLGDLQEEKELSTNWYRLFFGCFVENMNGFVPYYLNMHGNTMSTGVQSLFNRFEYFHGAAESVRANTDVGLRSLYALYGFYTVMTMDVYRKFAERRMHNLSFAMNNALKALSHSSQTNGGLLEKQLGVVASLLSDIKYEIRHADFQHPQRQKLHIQTLLLEHYYRDQLEIIDLSHHENPFFYAVSEYTEHSPEALRAMVESDISANNGIAIKIIRELSIRLARPIIIFYDTCGLDFKKQAFNSEDIPSGDPIFVFCNYSTGKFSSLRLRNELYFEKNFSKKLNATPPVEKQAFEAKTDETYQAAPMFVHKAAPTVVDFDPKVKEALSRINISASGGIFSKIPEERKKTGQIPIDFDDEVSKALARVGF